RRHGAGGGGDGARAENRPRPSPRLPRRSERSRLGELSSHLWREVTLQALATEPLVGDTIDRHHRSAARVSEHGADEHDAEPRHDYDSLAPATAPAHEP